MPKSCSFAALALTNLAQVSFLSMSEEEVFAEVIAALKETFSDDRDPTPEELQNVTGMELHECKAVLKAYLEATAASKTAPRKKKARTSKPAPPADDTAETMPLEAEEEPEEEKSTPTSEALHSKKAEGAKEEPKPSPEDVRRQLSFQSAAPTSVEEASLSL